jgi:hypothetical protein
MNFLVNYYRKKRIKNKKLRKNVKIKNITKHKVLTLFMFLFFISVGVFIYNLKHKINTQEADNVRVVKQLSEIEKTMKIRRLNQKARELNLQKLHLKYPKIEDYSRTYIVKNTYFYNIKKKKNELIKKGSIVTVIHHPSGNYYIHNKQLFKRSSK